VDYAQPVDSADELKELEASCIEDGLLTRRFGGGLRITKRGREVVKLAAITDEEVASALQDVLRTRWLDRGDALLTLVLFARQRLSTCDS
jgi:hypothetical protein